MIDHFEWDYLILFDHSLSDSGILFVLASIEYLEAVSSPLSYLLLVIPPSFEGVLTLMKTLLPAR